MEALLINVTLKTLLLFIFYFLIVGFNVILFAKIIKDREYMVMYRTRNRFYIGVCIIIPLINVFTFYLLSYILIFETNESKQ